MASLQITTSLMGIGLCMVILVLLRRDHLHLSHGLFWMIVAGAAAVLGLWPGLIDQTARLAGISYPPALLFAGTTMVLVIKALHADIVNTRIERQVRRLNQRLALFELERQAAERP
jgi:hypothetical protein